LTTDEQFAGMISDSQIGEFIRTTATIAIRLKLLDPDYVSPYFKLDESDYSLQDSRLNNFENKMADKFAPKNFINPVAWVKYFTPRGTFDQQATEFAKTKTGAMTKTGTKKVI